jgi:glycosyltransferase involved in cell wall biosynthesis
MKILTVSNLYPPHYIGGYELRAEVAVNALRARGHTVRVLTSNHGVTGSNKHTPEHDVARTLRIHGFFGHPWLAIQQLRDLELHNNRLLREAIAEFKPDVVHVWNLGGLSKSICLTLQQLAVPTVFSVSDHWIARSLVADVWLDWWNRRNPSLPARFLRWFWTLTGGRKKWSRIAPTQPVGEIRFPRINFCSRALLELTAAKGYPVQGGEVIYCSVDTQRFHGQPVPASRPLRKLLWVGRLAEDKGIMTALKAMAAVKGRFSGELHVYGKGETEYTDMLTSFVKNHALPVHFHSAGNAEMPMIYRDHDALLFTSEWEEPFALTPLEAMASGLPVVGTMTGGSKELFRHGENALTYTAGNADELAQRICDLDEDPAARARIAATGHAEVRARYAESVIMDQMERYLVESVRSTPPRVRVPGRVVHRLQLRF